MMHSSGHQDTVKLMFMRVFVPVSLLFHIEVDVEVYVVNQVKIRKQGW